MSDLLDHDLIVDAFARSDVDYISKIEDKNVLGDIIGELEIFDPSIELIDYLCQFTLTKNVTIRDIMCSGSIDKFIYFKNKYGLMISDELIIYLMYCVLEPKCRPILYILLNEYKDEITLNMLYSIRGLLNGTYDVYAAKDHIAYIISKIIDTKLLDDVNVTDNLLIIEWAVRVCLSCDSPQYLIDLLLNYLPSDHSYHLPDVRVKYSINNNNNSIRIIRPLDYHSLFEEDI